MRTAPHQPAWCLPGLRPLLRIPERSLSSSDARGGPRSSPRTAPKLRSFHLLPPGTPEVATPKEMLKGFRRFSKKLGAQTAKVLLEEHEAKK